MGKTGYSFKYGTLNDFLRNLTSVMLENDYCIIQKGDFSAWFQPEVFIGGNRPRHDFHLKEEIVSVGSRSRHDFYFVDEKDQEWCLKLYSCTPPKGVPAGDWWFVDRMKLDNRIIVRSNVTISFYERMIQKENKQSNRPILEAFGTTQ